MADFLVMTILKSGNYFVTLEVTYIFYVKRNIWIKEAVVIMMEICLAYLADFTQLKQTKCINVVLALAMALILSWKNITQKGCMLNLTLIHTCRNTHAHIPITLSFFMFY